MQKQTPISPAQNTPCGWPCKLVQWTAGSGAVAKRTELEMRQPFAWKQVKIYLRLNLKHFPSLGLLHAMGIIPSLSLGLHLLLSLLLLLLLSLPLLLLFILECIFKINLIYSMVLAPPSVLLECTLIALIWPQKNISRISLFILEKWRFTFMLLTYINWDKYINYVVLIVLILKMSSVTFTQCILI